MYFSAYSIIKEREDKKYNTKPAADSMFISKCLLLYISS